MNAKSIMAAITAAAAVCGMAFGAQMLDYQTSTVAEYREVFEHTMTIAQTNKTAAYDYALGRGLWGMLLRSDLDAVRPEFDAALADAGIVGLDRLVSSWPRIAAAGNAKSHLDERFPLLFGYARQVGCNASYGSICNVGIDVVKIGGLVGLLSEAMQTNCIGHLESGIKDIDTLKRGISYAAQKAVKRKLRREGKSFVTKNGVNPVEERLTGLTAALNAPRFAGLNEWLASMEVSASVDLSQLPSDSDVRKLREAVLDGEVDMSAYVKSVLYVCLGVDGYNAFVKEYNGD